MNIAAPTLFLAPAPLRFAVPLSMILKTKKQ